jgi:hypothetical protein
MEAGKTERLEAAADAGAAALLAGACAYSLTQVASSVAMTVAGAGLAFAAALRGLRAILPEERVLPLAEFESPIPFETLDELVLGDADRIDAPARDELVLDDVLAKLGPDSRVVRLFDPASMPTPGELQARIDRHLSGGGRSSPPPDASQALHDALAELRRSLN